MARSALPAAALVAAVKPRIVVIGAPLKAPCGTAAATIPSSSLVAIGESPPGPLSPACFAAAPLVVALALGWPEKVPRRLRSEERRVGKECRARGGAVS